MEGYDTVGFDAAKAPYINPNPGPNQGIKTAVRASYPCGQGPTAEEATVIANEVTLTLTLTRTLTRARTRARSRTFS